GTTVPPGPGVWPAVGLWPTRGGGTASASASSWPALPTLRSGTRSRTPPTARACCSRTTSRASSSSWQRFRRAPCSNTSRSCPPVASCDKISRRIEELGGIVMVTLTETAAKKVTELRQEEGKPDWGLRIRLVGGGCSGMSYELGWEEDQAAGDTVIESHGIRVFVDQHSAPYLAGSEIDF